MRPRSGWSHSNNQFTSLKATAKSRAATAPDTHAPPEWLRRSYTRTIPEDLRTVEQLRLSFEDVRRQWAELCSSYVESKAPLISSSATCHAQFALQPGVRVSVDRLVSQLKAVKQELLAQLTRFLGFLCMPSECTLTANTIADGAANGAAGLAVSASLSKKGSFAPEEKWLGDLAGVSPARETATVAAHSSNAPCQESEEPRNEYFAAVWLARRVWVWSICLACATMDLELLSGSVSVSTELFFGCPFSSRCGTGAVEVNECHSSVYNSCYNRNGAISEQELYSSIAALLKTKSDGGAANATARVDAETHEIRSFFVFAASKKAASSSSSLSHMSPREAAACSEARQVVPHFAASMLATRDALWVHAAALCYSIVARDDTSAARLLAFFDGAQRVLHDRAGRDENRTPKANEPLPPDTEKGQEQVSRAISFVLRVATLLLDEDYVALQHLWQSEGYGVSCEVWQELPHEAATPHVKAEATRELGFSGLAPLAAVCPEAHLLVLLIRLLSEHVVRRRWTEQGVGQAFRPIEPVVHPTDVRKEDDEKNLNRLITALVKPSRYVAKRNANTIDAAPRTTSAETEQCGTGARRLCDALQIAALRDMGGDWPLPGTLLCAVFGPL